MNWIHLKNIMGYHEEQLSLAKGAQAEAKISPRARSAMEGIEFAKGKKQMKQGVVRKSHITGAVKTERQERVGSFGSKTNKLTASLAQHEAFLWYRKQHPGPPAAPEASLWPGLPWGVIRYLPTAVCGLQFLKPSSFKTILEALWKLEPEPSCNPVYWTPVPRGNKVKLSVGEDLTRSKNVS